MFKGVESETPRCLFWCSKEPRLAPRSAGRASRKVNASDQATADSPFLHTRLASNEARASFRLREPRATTLPPQIESQDGKSRELPSNVHHVYPYLVDSRSGWRASDRTEPPTVWAMSGELRGGSLFHEDPNASAGPTGENSRLVKAALKRSCTVRLASVLHSRPRTTIRTSDDLCRSPDVLQTRHPSASHHAPARIGTCTLQLTGTPEDPSPPPTRDREREKRIGDRLPPTRTLPRTESLRTGDSTPRAPSEGNTPRTVNRTLGLEQRASG